MKQTLLKSLSVFALALTASTSWAATYDFLLGDLYYRKTSASTVAVAPIKTTGGTYTNTSYVIPDTITYEGAKYAVKAIDKYAFRKCSNVKSVTIPETVDSIGYGAFSQAGLTSLVIPNSVKVLDSFSINYLQDLTSITIGNSVEVVGNYAFLACVALKEIKLPETVKSIGSWAFMNCIKLESFNVPASTISISNRAFAGDSALTNFTVSNGNTAFKAVDGVLYTANGDSLVRYPGGKAGSEYTVLSGTKVLGFSSFEDVYQLKKINLPDGLQQLYNSCFTGCQGLESVNIPQTVTLVGNASFYNCQSLKSVDIPDAVTKIDEKAFYGSSSLETVTIGTGIQEVKNSAFVNCSAIKSVTVKATTPPSNTSSKPAAIFNAATLNEATLYVPESALEAYKASDVWNTFTNIKAITTSDVASISHDSQVRVRANSGTLTVDGANGYTVVVYSISGAQVAVVKNYSGETLTLPAGVYVVKAGSTVRKVVI